MEKFFWVDPYQTQLTTKVAAVDGPTILLEQTIAFSFSGGQESDAATINEMPVLSSNIQGQLIFYNLEDNHGLTVGDTVDMKINWLRRYRLMRLHFAAELILEIVTQKYHLEKIGAHIAEGKARIDFMSNKNISAHFSEILDTYNNIIEADATIHTGFTDVENQQRFWEIEGFSKVACGGTHVKSTAEVGLVTLKRVNIGASKERIEIKLVDSNASGPDTF